MSFLAPLFLLGLGALVLPIVLHLLRRRVTRTVPFPALRFLAATRADQRHQRLRRRLVLTLRCLALAALAAAFARPFFGTPPNAHGRATVVVVDNSFSLQAGDRWAALRRWALEQVGQPAQGDTLGVLLMNPRPAWLVAPTRDTTQALVALQTLSPGWHATRAEPALRLAGDILAGAPAQERRIVYLGDHQALGWTGADFAKKLPAGVAVSFAPPRPAPASQAALSAARLVRTGDAWSVEVTARAYAGRHARTVSVFAENATTPLATAPLALAPGETTTVSIALPTASDSSRNAAAPAPASPSPENTAPPPAGATSAAPPPWLRVSLDPDDLAADDTLWLVAPAARGDRLLLLDRAPLPAGQADHVATAYEALAALPPGLRLAPLPAGRAWPLPAAVVLRHDASFSPENAARLDAFLAAGGSAFVFIDGGPAQLRWLADRKITPRALPASTANQARLRDWALDHPLIAPLAETNLRSLVGWSFARAWSLPADGVEPLAFWADGSVAIGETRVGSGRLLLAGFRADRRDGDWPVQTAFVPFLHRAAAYLLGVSATSEAAPRVGAPLAAPEGVVGAWRVLAGPAAKRAAADIAAEPVASPSALLTPDAPGIYEFTAPGAPRRLFAVGLSPDESDLTPWSDGAPWTKLVSADKAPAAPPLARVAAAAADTEQENPLWWWAFAALGLFALAELTLANRTTR